MKPVVCGTRDVNVGYSVSHRVVGVLSQMSSSGGYVTTLITITMCVSFVGSPRHAVRYSGDPDVTVVVADVLFGGLDRCSNMVEEFMWSQVMRQMYHVSCICC